MAESCSQHQLMEWRVQKLELFVGELDVRERMGRLEMQIDRLTDEAIISKEEREAILELVGSVRQMTVQVDRLVHRMTETEKELQQMKLAPGEELRAELKSYRRSIVTEMLRMGIVSIVSILAAVWFVLQQMPVKPGQ